VFSKKKKQTAWGQTATWVVHFTYGFHPSAVQALWSAVKAMAFFAMWTVYFFAYFWVIWYANIKTFSSKVCSAKHLCISSKDFPKHQRKFDWRWLGHKIHYMGIRHRQFMSEIIVEIRKHFFFRKNSTWRKNQRPPVRNKYTQYNLQNYLLMSLKLFSNIQRYCSGKGRSRNS